MKRVHLLAVSAAALALAAAPSFAANSQGVTLHPSGFGEKSYAAWKAHEGEADSTGGAAHALYFQKNTSTATYAAGVAVFNGIDDLKLPVAGLKLAFDRRVDGVCGGGAPRFNVTLDNGQTLFIGCQMMAPSNTTDPRWEHREITLPDDPTGATVTGLAIVFDEGTDVPRPEGVQPGKTWLDNIQVNNMTWTGPADNGK